MAASIQPHFHLVDTATPGDSTTDGEWKAMAPNLKPQALPSPAVYAKILDAIDGTRHFHILKDGADPILTEDWQLLVRCADWSTYETLRDYLGTLKYFIPHYHDPAAHNSYTTYIYVAKINEIKSPGPTMPVLYVPLYLIDASRAAS
jgi:hypothetical protein